MVMEAAARTEFRQLLHAEIGAPLGLTTLAADDPWVIMPGPATGYMKRRPTRNRPDCAGACWPGHGSDPQAWREQFWIVLRVTAVAAEPPLSPDRHGVPDYLLTAHFLPAVPIFDLLGVEENDRALRTLKNGAPGP